MHFPLSGTAIVQPLVRLINPSRMSRKRLKILFWDLTQALGLYLRLVLLAIEFFPRVGPQIIRCGFTLLSEPEIPAGWTWWVVVLKT